MLKEKALSLVVVNFVFLPIATITMGLRLHVRSVKQSVGADDYLLLAGLVLFAITIAMSTAAAFHGVGVHNYGASTAEMRDGVMYFSLWQLSYILSTVPVKASIAISLIRITMSRACKVILWVLIVLSCVVALLACFSVFFTCRPMAFTWDKTIKGECGSLGMIYALSYTVSAMNIITDWTCAIMPVFILWDLQMRRKLKISVCFIMGLGAVASTATLVRLKFIPAYSNVNDYLYGLADIALWSVVEIGLGIIAGSIATLKPLLNKVFGSTTDPESDHTLRPYSGSYQLHDASKSGVATTVAERRGSDYIDASGEDTASQRRMLHGLATERQSVEKHSPGQRKVEGITVTYDISVRNEDKKERRVEEMI